MRTGPVILLLFAGCWTSTTPSTTVTTEAQPARTTPPTERRAILRIDAEPAGKKFQGVWLEFADGTKWVIDYRPRLPWRPFADREVHVTGGCYEPLGQAITATHFRVDRMRFVAVRRGAAPYLEVGPEQLLRGEVVAQTAPAGSKLAGTSTLVFRSDDGGVWPIVSDQQLVVGTRAVVRGRLLVADLTYASRSGEADLWIASTYDSAYTEDPVARPKSESCR